MWHLLPKGQGLALCLRKIVVEKVGYVDRYIHDIDRKILEEPALSINASTDLKRREKKTLCTPSESYSLISRLEIRHLPGSSQLAKRARDLRYLLRPGARSKVRRQLAPSPFVR
jgi:hypothetical protein